MNGNEKDWVEHVDRQLDTQGGQISELTKMVAGIASSVDILTKNQTGLFTRQNRPFQWGWFLSAIGLLFIGGGLVVTPIHRQLDTQHQFNVQVMKHLETDAYQAGAVTKELEWLNKMEDRLNERIHKRVN